MPRKLNVPAAYQQRHTALVTQLRHVKSKNITKQLENAIYLSGVVVATLFDLMQLVQRVAVELKVELDSHNKEAQLAVTRLVEATAEVANSNSEQEANTNMFSATVARLQVSRNATGIDIAILKSELIQTMSLMWLEVMEDLFKADNRRVFFARVEKLIEYASSKLPGVGDALEALKTVAEIYAIRKKQAQDADNYFLSLESYVDAANVFLTGVLAFCENAERSLAGAPEPTSSEVEQRIAAHVANVIAGAHPTSAKGAA